MTGASIGTPPRRTWFSSVTPTRIAIAFIPGFFGGIADGTPTSAWGRQKLLSHSGVLGFTHIFTPTLTNEFRFGYERNYSYAQQDPFGLNQVDQYVPGVPQNPAVAGGISQTYFDTEGALIGSPDFLPKFQTPQQFQLIDSVSLLAGLSLVQVRRRDPPALAISSWTSPAREARSISTTSSLARSSPASARITRETLTPTGCSVTYRPRS